MRSKKPITHFIEPWVKDYIPEAKAYYQKEYEVKAFGGLQQGRSKTLRYFDALERVIDGEKIDDLSKEYNVSKSNLVTMMRSIQQRVKLYLSVEKGQQ